MSNRTSMLKVRLTPAERAARAAAAATSGMKESKYVRQALGLEAPAPLPAAAPADRQPTPVPAFADDECQGCGITLTVRRPRLVPFPDRFTRI